MIIKVHTANYDGASEFMDSNCKFEDVIKEFDINLDKMNDYIKQEFEHIQEEFLKNEPFECIYMYLNRELAWCDEDIIKKILHKKEGKYYLNFIEEKTRDYFQVLTIIED